MPGNPTEHFEAASTLAIVVSSNEPLLFLTAGLRVIAASASFCQAFGIDPATIPGRPLSEIGQGEWAMPKLASLLNATASGSARIEAYEIDLVRPNRKNRQLIVNARTLDGGDAKHVRLLLAVTDVTNARAQARPKDDLVRDKAMLLQEVQHRVANSLQIIASVLMQSARQVQSEEARGHLHSEVADSSRSPTTITQSPRRWPASWPAISPPDPLCTSVARNVDWAYGDLTTQFLPFLIRTVVTQAGVCGSSPGKLAEVAAPQPKDVRHACEAGRAGPSGRSRSFCTSPSPSSLSTGELP